MQRTPAEKNLKLCSDNSQRDSGEKSEIPKCTGKRLLPYKLMPRLPNPSCPF